jgi:pilus assembly protein CpaB
MDKRFITVLGVSLVFALVVSAVFYQMTSSAGPSKPAAAVTDLKDLVIAARPLSPGTTVTLEDLKVVKVPQSQFPKGGFAKVEEVAQRPVASPILLEEPVLEGRLGQRGGGVGLAPIIPPGMRALTVRVNDIVGVAGYVLPNMRVDVLITGDPPGRGTRVTRTVLQNILVLSAGTTLQTDQTGKPVNASSVTLLVTPGQAETLTLAANGCTIQLVLRNGADQDIAKTGGYNMHELYGIPAREIPRTGAGGSRPWDDIQVDSERPRPARTATPAPAVAPPPPPPVPDQMIVIRGIEKRVETIATKKDEGKNP